MDRVRSTRGGNGRLANSPPVSRLAILSEGGPSGSRRSASGPPTDPCASASRDARGVRWPRGRVRCFCFLPRGRLWLDGVARERAQKPRSAETAAVRVRGHNFLAGGPVLEGRLTWWLSGRHHAPPSSRQRRGETRRRCSALVHPPPRVRLAGPPAADGVPSRTRGENTSAGLPVTPVAGGPAAGGRSAGGGRKGAFARRRRGLPFGCQGRWPCAAYQLDSQMRVIAARVAMRLTTPPHISMA